MAGLFGGVWIEIVGMARGSCGLEAVLAFFLDELTAIFEQETEGVEVDFGVHFSGEEGGFGVNH